jgi:CHAD domain-containing protein
VSSSTTAQFAKEQGDKLLRSLSSQIVRTIRTPNVDEVHDLRVAIRRFTRILVALKPCFPRGESRRIRRGLKRIMVQAGAVRDQDIAMRLLTRLALSETGPRVVQLREQRKEAAATLVASLRRWVHRNLPARWREALESGGKPKGADARFGSTPVDIVARRILPDMATEHFQRAKDAARDKASVKEIHRFRIADKNLRYTLDLFAPLYGDSLLGLIEQLKDVQALLGDINDCATVRRMLSRQKAGKEVLLALKKRQRRKIEQFQQHYAAEFSSAATLRQWKAILRRVGGPNHIEKKSPAPPPRPTRRLRVVKQPAA